MKKTDEKVYRIYTEDVRRREIIKATARQFDNFTLHPTTGFYDGQAEKSIVIEIVKATDEQIETLARKIQELNGQKTILIMSLNGEAAVRHAEGTGSHSAPKTPKKASSSRSKRPGSGNRSGNRS
jgi:DNA-binding transcriptional MerR regulator